MILDLGAAHQTEQIENICPCVPEPVPHRPPGSVVTGLNRPMGCNHGLTHLQDDFFRSQSQMRAEGAREKHGIAQPQLPQKSRTDITRLHPHPFTPLSAGTRVSSAKKSSTAAMCQSFQP